MTVVVAVLVVAGLALALLTGIAGRFDLLALVLFGGLVLFGALGIAVSKRATTGAVAPARCARCDGLLSPHAPYCKHCGAPTS